MVRSTYRLGRCGGILHLLLDLVRVLSWIDGAERSACAMALVLGAGRGRVSRTVWRITTPCAACRNPLAPLFCGTVKVHVDDFMGGVKEYRTVGGKPGSQDRPKSVSTTSRSTVEARKDRFLVVSRLWYDSWWFMTARCVASSVHT